MKKNLKTAECDSAIGGSKHGGVHGGGGEERKQTRQMGQNLWQIRHLLRPRRRSTNRSLRRRGTYAHYLRRFHLSSRSA